MVTIAGSTRRIIEMIDELIIVVMVMSEAQKRELLARVAADSLQVLHSWYSPASCSI